MRVFFTQKYRSQFIKTVFVSVMIFIFIFFFKLFRWNDSDVSVL